MDIYKMPLDLQFKLFRDSGEPSFLVFLKKLENKWYDKMISYYEIERSWKDETE